MTKPTSGQSFAQPNARRRAVLAIARDILIGARVIELRRLAERTARGELPFLDDDPAQRGDGQ
jgi:hypothetical protein